MNLRDKLVLMNVHLKNARHSLDQAEEIANEEGLSFSFDGYSENVYNSMDNEVKTEVEEDEYDVSEEEDDYYESSEYYEDYFESE